MRKNISVIFVHNFLIDYRMPLFIKLEENFDFVLYYSYIHKSMKFIKKMIQNYKKLHSIGTPDFSLSPKLLFVLLRNNIDVFIAGDAFIPNSWITFSIAKIRRKPFILWEERWKFKESLFPRLFWPFMQFIYHHSDFIIVPGSRTYSFISQVKTKTNTNIIRIPNACLDLSGYNRNTIGESNINSTFLELKKNNLILLYLGRFLWWKGLENLLMAYKQVQHQYRKIHLVLIGKGPLRTKMNKIIETERIERITFLGDIYDTRKFFFLRNCDIFIYPSSQEVWGLAINEAMALGKAVITTNTVGGYPDLLKDRINAIIIPPNDINALKSAIELLVNDKNLRNTLGEKAKTHIEQNFSYNLMITKFIQVIDQAFHRIG